MGSDDKVECNQHGANSKLIMSSEDGYRQSCNMV